MFEVENNFYEKNKELFRKEYLNEHIVICGEKLMGVYDSDIEAFNESIKAMDIGMFFIKIVEETDEDSIQGFRSRVDTLYLCSIPNMEVSIQIASREDIKECANSLDW